jgi:hypothetical protein
MPRVLLLATTTGYQTRAFGDAAERIGVDLIFGTDRCDVLEDPWMDRAIPIRFHDESASTAAVLEATRSRPLDGVLTVGDRPTVIGARVLEALGLPGHSAEAAAVARNKRRTREALRAAGLPVPWFLTTPVATDPRTLLGSVSFPCVVKPLALSGSRGVMRADSPLELVGAFDRLRRILQAPDIRNERHEAHDHALVEGFVEGREFAVEGVLNHGSLHVLAIFDKPNPLNGPFFEETIYVTPSRAARELQQEMAVAVGLAARAIGLSHGPVHAEVRASEQGHVVVLEVAGRPIGGLCARALRFWQKAGRVYSPDPVSLEELLLRHALGESTEDWRREEPASGVMMIPIPRAGVYRRAAGLDGARRTPLIDDIRITAKPDQVLVPLPEGASYLGFIFARGDTPSQVEGALRDAHARLQFTVDPEVRVLQSPHG